MSNIPDHPDIAWCERTGYPQWAQPTDIYCNECGKLMDGEPIYEDALNECLCERCLLMLHEKRW